jgi:hypothetical protein
MYAGAGLRLVPGGLGIVTFPDVGVLPFFVRAGVAVHI